MNNMIIFSEINNVLNNLEINNFGLRDKIRNFISKDKKHKKDNNTENRNSNVENKYEKAFNFLFKNIDNDDGFKIRKHLFNPDIYMEKKNLPKFKDLLKWYIRDCINEDYTFSQVLYGIVRNPKEEPDEEVKQKIHILIPDEYDIDVYKKEAKIDDLLENKDITPSKMIYKLIKIFNQNMVIPSFDGNSNSNNQVNEDEPKNKKNKMFDKYKENLIFMWTKSKSKDSRGFEYNYKANNEEQEQIREELNEAIKDAKEWLNNHDDLYDFYNGYEFGRKVLKYDKKNKKYSDDKFSIA